MHNNVASVTDTVPTKPKRRSLRHVRNLALFAVGTVLIGAIVVSVGLGIQRGQNVVYPPRAKGCCETPATYNLPYRDVTLQTEDNLKLAAWYVPGSNRAAVIVGHGAGGNRFVMMPYIRLFAKHGYGVLVPDLRAHGESEGDKYGYGWRDYVAAAAFLNTQPEVEPGKIAAFGTSLGANVALQGAAHTLAIGAILLDGAGPMGLEDFGPRDSAFEIYMIPYDVASVLTVQSLTGESYLSMREAVRQIAPRPLFIIASTGDQNSVEMRTNRRIFEVAQEPKTIWELDVSHASAFANYPDEYEKRVIAFLDSALLNRAGQQK